ncbi:unnamed protein product [Closterium sp. NIES-64]|nr:unnamed protein product [Closterium sp. NIES-64]
MACHTEPITARQHISPLPALEGTAVLTIMGACAVDRCIISGGNAFPIFKSPSSGSTGGILTLRNLTFQDAAGGVFVNVRTRINATECGFVRNKGPSSGGGVLRYGSGVLGKDERVSGVLIVHVTVCIMQVRVHAMQVRVGVTGDGVHAARESTYGTGEQQSTRESVYGACSIASDSYSVTNSVSYRYFSYCTFYNNTTPIGGGGAFSINAGNPQGKGPSLIIASSYFRNNSAPKGRGGVIAMEGTSKAVFKSCLFDGNSAGVAGGAIYSNGASLTLNKVVFRDNKAIGVPPTSTCGVGGVLFAVSGLYSGASVRLCASSFVGNTGCATSVNTLLLQTVPGGSNFPASVMFCNGTTKPAKLLVPSSGWRELSSCTPSTCL